MTINSCNSAESKRDKEYEQTLKFKQFKQGIEDTGELAIDEEDSEMFILDEESYIDEYPSTELTNEEKKAIKDSLEKASFQYIKSLHSLKFFKFTAPENLEATESEYRHWFVHRMISGAYADYGVDNISLDYKYFFADYESLFEAGGFDGSLHELKPYFEKRNLKLIVSNEIDEIKGNYRDHRISINGKEYVAFEGNMNDSPLFELWQGAADTFIEMVNDQLKIQGSNERLYGIGYGNDGAFIFLTKKQLDFLMTQNFDRLWRPRP